MDCCYCESSGYFSDTCPVPGVLAHIENNIVARRSVERCDACQRFDSDEEAVIALQKYGIIVIG